MGLFMCNSPILIQSGLRPPALPPKVCKSQRLAHADLFMLFPIIQKAA